MFPELMMIKPMTDPWDEKVYLPIHEWLIFYGFHVGKYTMTMDPMGNNDLK